MKIKLFFLLYRHQFHKDEIETWLLENQTCPICKIDILKAYDLDVSASIFDLLKKNLFSYTIRGQHMFLLDECSRTFHLIVHVMKCCLNITSEFDSEADFN